MKNRLVKLIVPLSLLLVSGTYYYLLSSKILTWMFVSGDAGDWLIQLRWWMVPHTFGKPIYILMIHALAPLPFNDIAKLTAISIASGAITVAITYLIALKLTNSVLKSVAAALVLLGAAMFLSQSTVIEQLSSMAMFFSLFFHFYITERRILSMVSLGLLTSSHVLGVIIFLIFLALVVIKYREYRLWLKPIIAFVVFGIMPYALIPLLMYLDTPRFTAGSLSIVSLIEYMTANTTASPALAVVAFPERIFQAIRIWTVSLGFAIIPLFYAKKGLNRKTLVLSAGVLIFILWLYLTNLFPSCWKYTVVILPTICALGALGLANMKQVHTYLVIASATALIVTNTLFFNINQMAYAKPLATQYIEFLENLPDGTGIMVPRGGPHGFGLFYVLSKGKDLVPIAIYRPLDETRPISASYRGHLDWVEKTYGIKADGYEDILNDRLNKGYQVYFPLPTERWKNILKLGETGYLLKPITNDENEIYEVKRLERENIYTSK